MQTTEKITMEYTPEWIETNTFVCPRGFGLVGDRITPEKCAELRENGVCSGCNVWQEESEKVQKRRRLLIEGLREQYLKYERFKYLKDLPGYQWRKYRLKFKEPILGVIPLNKEVYTEYIASRIAERSSPPDEMAGLMEEERSLAESIAEELEKRTSGFFKDELGVFLLDYHIVGFFKEVAHIYKETLAELLGRKTTRLRSSISQVLKVYPRRIYIAKQISGYIERPLRAMTMQGPRVALVRSEMVEGAEMEFEVGIPEKHKHLTWEAVEAILHYGRVHGIGGWRTGGYGRFVWERA